MEHVLHLYFSFFRLVDQRVKIVSRIRKELIGKGIYQYDKRYFVKLDAQIRWYYERSIKHDRFSKFHKLNLIKLSSFKIIIIIEITNHKRGI